MNIFVFLFILLKIFVWVYLVILCVIVKVLNVLEFLVCIWCFGIILCIKLVNFLLSYKFCVSNGLCGLVVKLFWLFVMGVLLFIVKFVVVKCVKGYFFDIIGFFMI